MSPSSADIPSTDESDAPGVPGARGGGSAARPAEAESSDVDRVTEAVLTASRLLVAVSARSLHEAEDRLTLPQFRALVVLFTRGPLRLTALAGRLGVSPSAALRTAERLHVAGMIHRDPNPDNRRESILSLTPVGRRCVAHVTERRRIEIAAIVARMPGPDRAHLVAALEAFSAAGDEPPAGPATEAFPLGWL
jgi:DNA-binding MarR family transcriptional regulator